MARLLDSVARRLAEQDAVSRRDLVFGLATFGAAGADATSADARPLSPPQPVAHEASLPAPTARDVRRINAALRGVKLSPKELDALIDAMKTQTPKGPLHPDAIAAIGRVRKKLHLAHLRVAELHRHSAVRADVLTMLAANDAILADVLRIARTTDDQLVGQLRRKSKKL